MILTILLFMAVIALFSLLVWTGLCAVLVLYKSEQAKKHDQRYTSGGTIAGFVTTGLLGQAVFWVIAWFILQGVASGTALMMQAQAQTVFNAAVSYAEKTDTKIHTVIGSNTKGADYAYDSLEAEIIRQFPYEQAVWFAVVTDKKGNVTAAYVSRHELTREELRPTDLKEQQKAILNLKQGENAVVSSWTLAQQKRQEERNGIPHAE